MISRGPNDFLFPREGGRGGGSERVAGEGKEVIAVRFCSSNNHAKREQIQHLSLSVIASENALLEDFLAIAGRHKQVQENGRPAALIYILAISLRRCRQRRGFSYDLLHV